MAGGEEKARKRKRKTISERNNLLRQPLMDQSKHVEKKGQRQSDDVPSCSTYSLRSHKGNTAASNFAPDLRICKSITQGRLTRKLGLFSYSKSSDCIFRGPIPETESVKKKVEEGLKRLVDPDFVPEASCSTDFCSNGITAPSLAEVRSEPVIEKKTHERGTSTGSVTASVLKESHQTCRHVQTSAIPVSMSHSASSTVVSDKKCPKSNKSDSSCESVKSDNELDEVLPINDVADKMLFTLKPKFKKMFPKRDFNAEINSSLQKLLTHSSHKLNLTQHAPVITQDNEMPISEAKENPMGEGSILQEAFRNHPLATSRSGGTSNSSQFQHQSDKDEDLDKSPTISTICNLQNQQHHHQDDTNVAFNIIGTINRTTSSPPQNQYPIFELTVSDLEQSYTTQPTAHFLNPNDIRLKSRDVEMQNDDEGSQSLNTIYIPSSTSLSSLRRKPNNPTSPVGFVIPSSFGDTDVSDSHPIIIDINTRLETEEENDQDSGYSLLRYNAFLASARSLKAKLEKQNVKHHSTLPCKHLGSSTYGTRRAHLMASSNHCPSNCKCQQRDTFASKHYMEEGRDTISGISNLAQSRNHLKNVLDSILISNLEKQNNASTIHNNEESMDWHDVDILPTLFSTRDEPHLSTQDIFYKRPLDELRVHQSDMQHQARSFLEQDFMDVGHSDDHVHVSSTSGHSNSSVACPSNSTWL